MPQIDQPLVRPSVLLRVAIVVLVAGLGVRTMDARLASVIWLTGLLVCSIPMLFATLRSTFRGNASVDLIASMAVLAALLTQAPLPGLIIVIMQSGGELLEEYARGRATDAVRALEEEVPRIAHRLESPSEGLSTDVEVGAIRVGDTLLLRPGETAPCDGVVVDGASHVNTARLTGESVPRAVARGAELWSGMVNGEGALTLRATATAGMSQYAKLVEMVRYGQASKAPLARLADRAAVWFTPFTLLACAITYMISQDADRVLAVLVVATPCPLILATPIAIIGGIDRAASRGIIFRTGAALEQLASATVAAFDKTGTITVGEPRVAEVASFGSLRTDELLALAAAVETSSSHALAGSVVRAATEHSLTIPVASDVQEKPGAGVSGLVKGQRVAVGSGAFARALAPDSYRAGRRADELRAAIVVDGVHAGSITFADQLRPEVPGVLARLRELSIRRTLLLSGDAKEHTARIASLAGIEDAEGELRPEQKVERIAALMAKGERVIMTGDGVNDAPALVAATVGVALVSGHGGLAATSASVVLLRDDLHLLPDAITISRRTMRIARESIGVGLGLSIAAMAVASAGHLPALQGALLQEVIDVAVILNALRSRGQAKRDRTPVRHDGSLARRGVSSPPQSAPAKVA